MSTTAKLQNFIPSIQPLMRLRSGYLRPIEFTAIGLLLFAVTGVGYLFFGVLSVRTQRIDALYNESKQVRDQINQFHTQKSHTTELATNTRAALDNLEEFNQRFLKDPRQGRLITIDELNKLIRKNNLTIQSAINFRSIEDADLAAAQEKSKKGRVRRAKSDSQDIYPGLHASFSVSGSYENFRKFLHDLETSNLFVIIERLGLQSTEAQAGQAVIRNVQSLGAPQGSNAGPNTLSVQLDLRIYFRKQGDATN